jgi:predicted dinucleotide-binding enzyme
MVIPRSTQGRKVRGSQVSFSTGGTMNYGILGTGMVGRALAAKLAQNGNGVMIGTRDPSALRARTGNDAFAPWQAEHADVQLGTFAEAAAYGDLLLNCTNGAGSLPALEAAGADLLGNKVLIDVSNPLDFSQGFPPSLFVCNTDSLAEQLQRAFPNLRVVKSLNSVTAPLMVNPASLPGDHVMYVSGNDEAARKQVADLLRSQFGWQMIIDLGDLSGARAQEMVLPLWLRLMGALGTPMFNFAIART